MPRPFTFRARRCAVALLPVASSVAFVTLVALATATAETPPAPEPAACTEAIEKQPDAALDALADAEREAWNEARALRREAKKLAKETMGLGASMRSVRATQKVAELDRRWASTLERARTICDCRSQRKDPHREDCDALYARYLPPRRDADR